MFLGCLFQPCSCTKLATFAITSWLFPLLPPSLAVPSPGAWDQSTLLLPWLRGCWPQELGLPAPTGGPQPLRPPPRTPEWRGRTEMSQPAEPRGK